MALQKEIQIQKNSIAEKNLHSLNETATETEADRD